jgi:putative addiction module killer protein
VFTIRNYLTADGKDVFLNWLKEVRDPVAKVQIVKRVNRVEQGNLGDHRFCRDGVWELRVDVGAGYRIYYAQAGTKLVLLLAGGDKRSQNADIATAVRYWQDWKGRTDVERPGT